MGKESVVCALALHSLKGAKSTVKTSILCAVVLALFVKTAVGIPNTV